MKLRRMLTISGGAPTRSGTSAVCLCGPSRLLCANTKSEPGAVATGFPCRRDTCVDPVGIAPGSVFVDPLCQTWQTAPLPIVREAVATGAVSHRDAGVETRSLPLPVLYSSPHYVRLLTFRGPNS